MLTCFSPISQSISRKIENKSIQSEEFNLKESQRYKVSVLMNHVSGLRKDDIEWG